MQSKPFTFNATDGVAIYTYCWLPEEGIPIKAVIQLAHGMAEHAGRYEDFAQYMTDRGFAVYANDHRGHKKTAGSVDELGYFADNNGWNRVVADMCQLTELIKGNHPKAPVFLFGHSMGSMLSREYVSRNGARIDGVILSATAGDPGFLGLVGGAIAKLEAMVRGKKAQSPLLDKLSFGQFNQAFKPNRTSFDWLSRDDGEVDKYIDDPYCGTIFTAGFFCDLLEGIRSINNRRNIEQIPKSLPIYFFSGAEDPVGDFKKGVNRVVETFRDCGLLDVECKFYEGGRHEMLKETNKEQVVDDTVAWINQRLKDLRPAAQ